MYLRIHIIEDSLRREALGAMRCDRLAVIKVAHLLRIERDGSAAVLKQTPLSLPTASTDPLVSAALDAARKSYSPYTLSHSGIAVGTSEQRIFVGSYIENAAFNPSLSPLEGALAGLFAAGQKAEGLTRAVLVETTYAKISQESVTRAALSSLAPAAHVQILKADRSS